MKLIDFKLFRAVEHNKIEKAQQLISKGANVNVVDQYGRTVLSMAIRFRNDYEMLKLLVNNGANVNAKTYRYGTVLHCAVQRFNYDAVQFLVDNGADINAKDPEGLTPIQRARRELEQYIKLADKSKEVQLEWRYNSIIKILKEKNEIKEI